MEDLTPEQRQAQSEVHDALQRLADALGPASFPDEYDYDADRPNGSTFLAEWVLVAGWVDEQGASFTTRIGSSNIRSYTRDGLLHEALYGFD